MVSDRPLLYRTELRRNYTVRVCNAQGSKQMLLGKSLYRYDPLHYLLATIGLPFVPQVLEASDERL